MQQRPITSVDERADDPDGTPDEPNESWFPRMLRWAEGEPFVIPDWPNALSQANDLLNERPMIRGARLVAWMLTKPNA